MVGGRRGHCGVSARREATIGVTRKSISTGCNQDAGAAGAVSLAMKPQVRWLPSQKGRFADWPQRQRATFSLPVRSNVFPRWSISVIGPVTRIGPFSRVLMVTSDMNFSCEEKEDAARGASPPRRRRTHSPRCDYMEDTPSACERRALAQRIRLAILNSTCSRLVAVVCRRVLNSTGSEFRDSKQIFSRGEWHRACGTFS